MNYEEIFVTRSAAGRHVVANSQKFVLSSDVYAPYASADGRVIVQRPPSAPAARQSNAVGPLNPHRPASAFAHNAFPASTDVTANAPYGERVGDITTPPYGPRIGCLPNYCSLRDPHLSEYFAKKFAHPQLVRSRPSSAPSRLSKKRKDKITCQYVVTVVTGSKKNAGTDAKVYVRLKGKKGKLPKHQLKKNVHSSRKSKSRFKFLKGASQTFRFTDKDIGDLESVLVEHDGLSQEDGWFLERIEVTKKVSKGKNKMWLFVCGQWLSLHEGDCRNSRELFAKLYSKTEYEVVCVTGNKRGAGTDANVFITIFGKSGTTPKHELKNNSKNLFEKGATDMFTLKTDAVGPINKIRIQHDNTGFAAGWFLERIVVTDLKNPKWKYYFPCGLWLAKDEGDGMICRDLLGSRDPLAARKGASQYKVTVYTGDKRGAGTDARVYCTIFGEAGDTGERKLDDAKNNFERRDVDTFLIDSAALGRLKRLRIGHDNSGPSSGWYLDKVIVDDLAMNKVYEFPCDRWLATDEDDGAICVDLIAGSGLGATPGVPYNIHVTTGDVSQAGTSARVYLVMYGGREGNESSGKIWLEGGKFARGRTDIFNIQPAQELSPLEKIEIGHDNSGPGAGWHLDRVMVDCPSAGYEQWFLCDKWLATGEGDGLIERTLRETRSMRKKRGKKTTWHVVVHTSDNRSAGTDSNVFLVIYGKSKGRCLHSDEVRLENKGDTFELGQADRFKVEAEDVGKPYKIRVYHDDRGALSGWHLDKIEMENMQTGKRYSFFCNQWLAKSEGDGSIIRECAAEGDEIRKPEPVVKYEVEVHTGDKRGAGTDANVFLNVFGEQGDTGDRPLEKSSSNRNKFERKSVDIFELEAVTLKNLRKIRIGHDGKSPGSGWFLDKVVVKQVDDPHSAEVFECNRWLDINEDDGQIVREITAGGAQMLNTTSYHVSVKTGDVFGAGTDANVQVKLFGEKSDTGTLQLKSSDNSKNKFERGRTDQFKIESTNIGKIKYIKIGHDGSAPGAGWFLDEVRIDVPSQGLHYVFACHRWLDKKEADGKLEVELDPTHVQQGSVQIPYEVTVWTGTKKGAGTDSKVFLQIYGDGGKTEEIQLQNRTDNFEQGQMDKFKIEADDVGPIMKVRIGHDGKGMFAGWFLDKMLIQRIPDKSSKRRKGRSRRKSSQRESSQRDSRREKSRSRSRRRGSSQDSGLSDEFSHVRSNSAQRRNRQQKTTSRSHGRQRVDSEEEELNSRNRRSNSLRGRRRNDWDEELSPRLKIRSSSLRGRRNDFSDDELSYSGRRRKSSQQSSEFRSKRNSSSKIGRDYSDDDDDDVGNDRSGKKLSGSTRQRGKSGSTQRRMNNGSHLSRTRTLDRLSDSDDEFEGRRINKKRYSSEDSDYTSGRTNSRTRNRNGNSEERRRISGSNKRNKSKSRYYEDEESDIDSYRHERNRYDSDDDRRHRNVRPFTSRTTRHIDSDDDYLNEKERKPSQSSRNRRKNYDDYDEKFNRRETNKLGSFSRSRRKDSDEESGRLNRRSLSSKSRSRKQNSDEEEEKRGKRNRSGSGNRRLDHDNGHRNQKFRRRSFSDSDQNDLVEETEDYWFFCNRWFAKGEDDGKIVRELVPTDEQGNPLDSGLEEVEYLLKVFTGDVMGAGTDANVFATITGEFGDTGERELSKSNNMNKWERNQEDVFKVTAIELGRLKKIKIRHDNKGGGAAWFLGHVEVVDLASGQEYFFPCQRWLATKEDDGQISRELVPVSKSLKSKLSRKDSMAIRKEVALETKAAMTTYEVKVHTGDKRGAGTDANVYVNLFGDKDATGNVFLKSSHNNKNKFERNQMDEFTVEAVDIGELQKLKIGHDNKGGGGAWYLEKIDIDCPSLGRRWIFPCNRWLAKSEDDGKLERELYPQEVATEEYIPCIPYEIKTYTSDISGAGSDADIYIVLYGSEICSQQKSLCPTKRERKKFFEKGKVDAFVLELEDVGDIEKIRIGHDGSGWGSGWHCDKVEIRRLKSSRRGGSGSETYVFPCKRWLAKDEEDGAIVRELVADRVTEEITRRDGSVKKRDLARRETLMSKKYVVDVVTGDERGAGTDANVYLNLYGDRGDTGERKLTKSETHRDKFERGQTDKFFIEAVDIGSIFKAKIRREDSLLASAWLLDRIVVTDQDDGQVYTFHCERWLSKGKDGKLERSLYVKGYEGDMNSTSTLRSSARIGGSMISMDSARSGDFFGKSPRMKRSGLEGIPEGTTIPYTVSIATGSERDAGTDASAWICIYGKRKLQTGKLFLDLVNNKGFRPNTIETFSLEANDVEEVTKIEIGHDGTSDNSGWFVKEVMLDLPTKGQHYLFGCKQWLARDRGDGKTIRVLAVKDGQSSMNSYKPKILHEMTVHTGDVKDAGTDGQVFVKFYGTKGASSDIFIDKKDRFERASIDLIKIELEDIGAILKMRAGIQEMGRRDSWFLNSVALRNMDTLDLVRFECKTWLGKRHDNKEFSKDFPAIVRGRQQVKDASYRVAVKTSNQRGAGTDANVFITLFGQAGDTGQIHLKNSESSKSPFRSNQTDTFILKDILNLGKLFKARVWHDDKGFGSSWHLESIEVEEMDSGERFIFPCNRWLSKSEDDGQITRELSCANSDAGSPGGMKERINYLIEVITSDKKDAGMIHNAWLLLEGKNRISKEFVMENSVRHKILRRGQTDRFQMTSRNLGRLKRCIVGATERRDKRLGAVTGREAMWHCHMIVVTNESSGDHYEFPVRDWIPIEDDIRPEDGKSVKPTVVEEGILTKTQNLGTVKYEVTVVTGDAKSAGTDANVFINIIGQNGDTGKRALTQKMRNLFERGQTDNFVIEAVDLGEITKIQIEHDNKGFGAGWLLDHVKVVNLATNVSWNFPCGNWLDKKKGDGQIFRELLPHN